MVWSARFRLGGPVGAFAAYQRGYFEGGADNCAEDGTITVTVVAGALNYLEVNPEIECKFPEPSG